MLAETSINDNAVREALVNVEVTKINDYLRSGKLDINKKFPFQGYSIWHYLALGKKKGKYYLAGRFFKILY